jgi:hypothetical protein
VSYVDSDIIELTFDVIEDMYETTGFTKKSVRFIVPLAKSLLAQEETFIGFVFKNAIDFSLRVISLPNLETSKVEVNLSKTFAIIIVL